MKESVMPMSPEREAEIRAIYRQLHQPGSFAYDFAHTDPDDLRNTSGCSGDDTLDVEPDYDSESFRKRFAENAPVYVERFLEAVRNKSDDMEDKEVKDE